MSLGRSFCETVAGGNRPTVFDMADCLKWMGGPLLDASVT